MTGRHADTTATAATKPDYTGRHRVDPTHTTKDDAYRVLGRLNAEQATR